MLTYRSWLAPMLVACFAFVAAGANATKKKEKGEVLNLKLSNLTNETPKKDVKKLETALKKIKGVTKVSVSKKKGELTVRYTKDATAEAIKAAVTETGFSVVEPNAEGDAEGGGSDGGADENYE